MIPPKFGLKLFADEDQFPDGHQFITVFHEWIRKSVLTELMVDVVDYGHVHHGPIVYFNGHESDFTIDLEGGRPGLLYRRKRAPDSARDRFEDGARRLLGVAEKLEAEPSLKGLRFETGVLEVLSYDRLAAPNSEDAFRAFAEAVSPTVKKLWGDKHSIERQKNDPRAPLAFTISGEARALGELNALLA